VKHLGWKIVFELSWILGFLVYGDFISKLVHMGEIDLESPGSIWFNLSLILSILFLGLQVVLGYLAFRHSLRS
jgi:putative effector of murein hydrolase LrgA (UPF0299 family)